MPQGRQSIVLTIALQGLSDVITHDYHPHHHRCRYHHIRHHHNQHEYNRHRYRRHRHNHFIQPEGSPQSLFSIPVSFG